MKIPKHFCRICKKLQEFSYEGRVPQKIDTFYFTCDKGHINEVYISKKLQEAIKAP